LLAGGHGDWGFTAFAITGVWSMCFIGFAALRTAKQGVPTAGEQELVGSH
ncbi:MAG: MFS transporter, partial [Streptomyces sp.]|nr:MFS transporter [Streptomyces sp.]NUR41673.1 MFS transporter [Streptomyces sp.]NUS12607.1 MFS transporter [Streptomyces sp.]